MNFLKTLLYFILLFLIIITLGYLFQANLIFFPGKLAVDYKFDLNENDEEVFLTTPDGETINGLFFPGSKPDVVLYFHGNAGDLSGWQFVAGDFATTGYNFFIIDYRGYGKSTGTITEKGFYTDAEAAYQFLINEKGFSPQQIIAYGRSIGTGVAVHLAANQPVKGLILESSYSSLKKLANQKMPFLLPSLVLKFHFNNLEKINNVRCPIIFIHGGQDTLIPPSHSNVLYEKFNGTKKLVVIDKADHNDISDFPEYHSMLADLESMSGY